MTVVGGVVVFDEGRCTLVDEDEVRAEAQARQGELLARLDLPPVVFGTGR